MCRSADRPWPGWAYVPTRRRWNLDNLRTYWEPWAEGARHETADLAAGAPVDAEVVAWGVLGPARLHFTRAHADVTTKAGAGEYLARHFPAWAALAGRAVAWRASGAGEFTVGDLRDAAACVDAVAADAWRRWGWTGRPHTPGGMVAARR